MLGYEGFIPFIYLYLVHSKYIHCYLFWLDDYLLTIQYPLLDDSDELSKNFLIDT